MIIPFVSCCVFFFTPNKELTLFLKYVIEFFLNVYLLLNFVMQTPAFNLFIKRWSESVIREVEHAQKRKDKPKLRRISSVSYYCYPFASFKSSNKYKRNEYHGQITKEQKCLNEPELLWYKRYKNALLVIIRLINDFKKAKTETDPAKLCFFKMTGVPRHRKHFRVAMMTCLLAILLPPTASRLAINAFNHLRNKN